MPTVVPCSSSSATRDRVTPADDPCLERRALEHGGQIRVDAAGPQRRELGDAQARERLAARGPVCEQAVDLLHQHEPPRADPMSNPGGDRVGGHVPGRGQRVEGQRGGQENGRPSGTDGREVGAALGARDQLAQQPAELLHAEDRHSVRGRRGQSEAAVGLAHGVREPPRRRARRAAGGARPSSPSAAHRPGSASSPRPPPTLTTVSTVPPAARPAPRPVPAPRPTVRGRPLALDGRRPRVPGTRRNPPRRPAPRASAHAPHGAPRPRSGAVARPRR